MPRGKLRKGKKTINSLIRPYLDRALSITDEELENNSNSSSKKFTFLHALARTTRDRQEINDELVGLLFAGRDTTAATLSWLFYELSDHPAMVQKIRSEIDDVLGPDSKRMPTLEELKRMKYLRNTVDETLRLYPPVPINVRHAARDTIISTSKSSQPLLVRKGDAVAYSTYLLQRRPDLCPPASSTFAGPNDFCPERWDHWTPAPWTYIPFNGGPRICVGQQFALTEIYFTTVRILQRFERLERVDDPQIGIDGDDRKQFMSSHIVGQPGRPVRVKFSERSQE